MLDSVSQSMIYSQALHYCWLCRQAESSWPFQCSRWARRFLLTSRPAEPEQGSRGGYENEEESIRRKSVALPESVNKRLTAYAQAAATALPEDLSKRLTAYALAAGAAGVGVLALAEPARADIITVTGPGPFVPFSSQRLTINGKGVLNFDFFDITCFGPCYGTRLIAFAGFPAGGLLVPPLAKGALVGPGGAFVGGATLAGHSRVYGTSFGPWLNKSGYLGFKFLSNSKTHFGWAHLKVNSPPVAGSISEFAYDTVPGQAIEAGQTSAIPEPGTLSLLALGAAGLAVLRKRKRSAVSRQGPPES